VLRKPIQPQPLLEAIRRHLPLRAAARGHEQPLAGAVALEAP
jgi:hypothetical protein